MIFFPLFRYLNSQREATQLHDLNERIEQEIKNKVSSVKLWKESIVKIEKTLCHALKKR
jgi:hypothetical protein